MSDRTVTDTAGRTWTCTVVTPATENAGGPQGRDVELSCATASVAEPVHLTVGWQWEKMAPAGLARMITLASPVPNR